ncbi:hypothetical protein ACP70R_006254 [Stipagrostis hirtigluma subsp. patula]
MTTMRNQILCRIVVVILLAPPLTVAAMDRSAAWRRRFMESRQARSLDGHAEPDPWADPASSFGHLPTKYMNPSGSKEADRIAALPGQPPRVDFRQYAGYVTVDEENGRELFYYFVESPSDAASKPLLLWFNSGPVCSSLGYGAMMELGPFRVNRDGKTLSRNEHAWNKVANVIFLEAPIGIGFSYSNTTSDYHHIGTGRAAMDMYFFMLHWLERFPEYKGRDFYIGGDGFAGRFAPKLASIIVASRKNTGKNPINLNGIFVGNPNLDVYKGERGRLEFLWNHGVISDEHWTNITKHCSFSPYDNETQCYDALYSGAYQALYTANNNTDVFDWDNIYAPTCIKSPNGTSYSSSYLPGYDPCVDVDVYFNDHEVQKAIHARINTRWEACGELDPEPERIFIIERGTYALLACSHWIESVVIQWRYGLHELTDGDEILRQGFEARRNKTMAPLVHVC